MTKEAKPVSYKALERGYVDGRIIEEGEVFITTAPKGSWMEPVDAEEYAAVKAATEPTPDDPNYDAMTFHALQAVAAEEKIPVAVAGKALSKAALITALKAKRQPTA